MGSFDIKTFAKIKGQTGTDALTAVGMSFGVPSCMLQLGRDVLALLPSSTLNKMRGKTQDGKKKANEVTQWLARKASFNTGLIEFNTETGRLQFKSIASAYGSDEEEGSFLDDLGGFLGAVEAAASFGGQLYQNYETIQAQFDSISDCIGKFKDTKAYQNGNSAKTATDNLSPEEVNELIDNEFAADIAAAQEAIQFVQQCNSLLTDIASVLAERRADPDKEPRFSDDPYFDPFLGDRFPRGPIPDPGIDPDEEVFRLIYGPPQTTLGQYVLTSDGLYYDSKGGGFQPSALDNIYLAISGTVDAGEAWKYDYDPNLGGKGDMVSIKSLNKFTDSLFDPEIIDDSDVLTTYYEADHLLQVLEQQRDKHTYDLSSQLTSYITEYGNDSSIVINHRAVIASNLALHQSKIRRRKKQIEVAVKAPAIYASNPDDVTIFQPGEVPINDFGYLENYNIVVDLQKQKALTFEQAEVNGVVLPIRPKFVAAPPKTPSTTYNHLNVPPVGKGGIIYESSGTTSATILSLTDNIVSDELIAVYNFLESTAVTPSSSEFKITNCATQDMYNSAKMVAPSKKAVWASGLAIPYLHGITRPSYPSTSTASGLGSYIRLPDTPEFRDLGYNLNGFTMECWVHVPNITDEDTGWGNSYDASSLTKLLLSCENTGSVSGASALDANGALASLDYLKKENGEDFTRGMMIGFTRDRRITQVSSSFSPQNHDNLTSSSLSFFIAPTQARDYSSIGFINNDANNCYVTPSFHNMKVDLSATNLGNVDSQFVLVDITVDPRTDTIRIYGDGSLLATSSLSTVFGTEKFTAINIPSFRKDNSFEYSSTTVYGPATLQQGPKLNEFFTPWIVGGGYTDGMSHYGNFMGGNNVGGISSGLRGYIGSLKFYSKPLNNIEVETNYKAQKGFFKSILT